MVLSSKESKVLLFLESKLSEYEYVKTEQHYGKSYYSLYKDLQEVLESVGINAEVNEVEDEMILKSNKALYIEGIKQTISHLIGLVKGPQHKIDTSYTSTEYENVYKDAKTLVYGTILFDPSNIGVDNNAFESYKTIYARFSKSSDTTIQVIRNWAGKSNKNIPIIVLPDVLTYQKFFPEEYLAHIPRKVRNLYGLNCPTGK